MIDVIIIFIKKGKIKMSGIKKAIYLLSAACVSGFTYRLIYDKLKNAKKNKYFVKDVEK